MPSTALFVVAQEMEKQLSRRVRQEGLFGESGWCLVRYYREMIDGIYNEAEGVDSLPQIDEAEARTKLVGLYERFEGDLKRIIQRSSFIEPSDSSAPPSDDEGSVLDDVASVYYEDLDESSPEPEDIPHTPSRTPPLSLYPGSERSVPSMIMSDDDASFLTLATPVPDRPCAPTPNATGEDKFTDIPFTPPPKHGFPGTYNPERHAELFLSRGVPYEAQFVNLDSVDPRVFLGNFKKNSSRDRKSLPALPVTPRVPNTPTSDGRRTTKSEEEAKKPKKKRSFWKRPSSSSDSEKKEKEKRKEKEREELKAPTFWCPM